MLKTLLVIQNIKENGKVEIYQAYSAYGPFQWAFETKRNKRSEDGEYFPFTISNVEVVKRPPGPETETKVNNNVIQFYDDYGIPEGSVIAILFPKNFIPDIIKFKDTPYIPVGISSVTVRPPGQLQIAYNYVEKRCAIILHIHERLVFGIKCIAKKVSDESFPENGSKISDELFDVSLSRQFLNVESIQTEHLKIINDALNNTDIIEVCKLLNEILEALKEGNKDKAQSLLTKFGKSITTGTSVVGNLTKILDSYNQGGSAHQFIKKIIEYVTL